MFVFLIHILFYLYVMMTKSNITAIANGLYRFTGIAWFDIFASRGSTIYSYMAFRE